MIDATIIRAQACAAGYKKNSQDQEALGNPLHFILTPGQRNAVTNI